MVPGEQARGEVHLLVVGHRHERIHLSDGFLEQEFGVGRITVDDQRPVQPVARPVGAVLGGVDQFDVDPLLGQEPGEADPDAVRRRRS